MKVGFGLGAATVITLALLTYSWLYALLPLRSLELRSLTDLQTSLGSAVLGAVPVVANAAASAVGTTPGYGVKPPEWATQWRRTDYVLKAGVQCSKLLRGDPNEVSRASAFVSANAASFKQQADIDDSLLLNASCADLLSAGYAQSPASQVEAEFPLAFGLRLHQHPAQAELLLRAIYAPQNVYCLHIDPKANPAVFEAMRHVASCLQNVHVVTPAEQTFVYGSVSPLLADITCMRLLLALAATRWRYFINLTGQELPLRTNYELVRLLMLYNGSNEIESAPGAIYEWRYQSSYWCRDTADGSRVRCPKPLAPKSPAPGNITVYKGLAYGFFSRAFVEFTLAEGEIGSILLRWFNDTYSPDENYWATLNRLPTAPGSYTGAASLPPSSRAVVWVGFGPCRGKFVRQICIFGVGDLPWLLSRHEAFANKFLIDYDPVVVQCLLEHVAGRTAREPHESDSWLVPWYWNTYLQLPQIRTRK